jgi:Fic family protein
MNPATTNRRIGTWIVTSAFGETVRAHMPAPLPPEPPADLTSLIGLLDKANQSLGRMDGIGCVLPDKSFYLFMNIRKEALLSSQVEGTQSSLADLLLVEGEERPEESPMGDVEEVSRYLAAMQHGLARLAGGFPLSLRLIREMHGVLLATGRGSHQNPGEFRTSQNWIGGTRPGNAAYVPPPPERLMECLDNLEKFLHLQREDLPVLAQAGMAHVQFESIHPFLDGNGRIGRLLITLFLCERGVLADPLLYLSLYMKQNRPRYYELLQGVREEGGWEAWLRFFLTGVAETANDVVSTARRIMDLRAADRVRVEKLGRAGVNGLRLFDLLGRFPILSIPFAARQLGLSHQTCTKLFLHLAAIGILHGDERQRGRIFRYRAYLNILSEGTEPLRP